MCGKVPNNVQQESMNCIDRGSYTMSNTIDELKIKKGDTFSDENASKACLIDITYAAAHKDNAAAAHKDKQPQPKYNSIMAQVMIENNN